MAFGAYSPQRAGELKDRLDRDLGIIENRVGHLLDTVPTSGSIHVRADEALDCLREVTQDLQQVIDQRTTDAAAPAAPTQTGAPW